MNPYTSRLSSLRYLLHFETQSKEYHVDWRQILDCPEIDVLLPLIHHRASHLGIAIPPKERSVLQQAYLKNKAHTALLKAALRTILSKWNQKGIEAMLLKGCVGLCVPFYPDSVRCIGDLDILVRESDLSDALVALGELGYKPISDPEESDHHAPVHAKPGGFAEVEVHWLPINRRLAVHIPATQLWNNAKETLLDGERVLIPCSEDLIWHKIIHDLFKHGDLWMSYPYLFRNLYELGVIFQHYRREMDWNVLVERAKRAGIEKGFYTLLFLLHHDLGLALPPDIIQGLDSCRDVERLRLWIYHSACLPKGMAYALHRFLLILMQDGGWLGRLRVGFQMLVLDAVFRETREFFQKFYHVGGKAWILPLRVFHLLRMLSLQFVVSGYYARFRMGFKRISPEIVIRP